MGGRYGEVVQINEAGVKGYHQEWRKLGGVKPDRLQLTFLPRQSYVQNEELIQLWHLETSRTVLQPIQQQIQSEVIARRTAKTEKGGHTWGWIRSGCWHSQAAQHYQELHQEASHGLLREHLRRDKIQIRCKLDQEGVHSSHGKEDLGTQRMCQEFSFYSQSESWLIKRLP